MLHQVSTARQTQDVTYSLPHTHYSQCILSQTLTSKEVSLERSAVDEAGEELEGLAGGGLRHLVATALHGHEGERALHEERIN